MNIIIHHVIVKIIDFSESKVNVGRNPKARRNNFKYGIPRYMALEVIKKGFKLIKICYFKLEIFSFVILCSKILTKKDLFHSIDSLKNILKRTENGERLNLPSNYNELIRFIKDYWNLNFF
uniref:Protein kinase domain-containing protein n=1 Tax=Physcomitrium patens TaxID=3218 RepID=A0A2K1K787_PHYPA|nr:hypothetical protein PHYPA_011532 [Physcomitrium patens]